MPNDKIGERFTRFGFSMRGTRSYWNKSRVELTNMINQQGTPTFFFTLSAVDTKWLDLDALMPVGRPTSLAQDYQWKIHNIISNPHITSQYIQNIPSRGASKRFSYNRFLVQVFYHLFLLILLFVFLTLYNSFLIYSFSSHVGMNGSIEDPHTFMVLFGW